MGSILNIFEMARGRGDVVWRVLDWAAEHGGTFTINDLINKYFEFGGKGDSRTSLYTTFMKLSAQQDKAGTEDSRGNQYWPPSEARPIQMISRGRQGGRSAPGTFKWGLSKPLRTPPEAQEPIGDDYVDDKDGDILDKLEKVMGRPALKLAMQRWRQLSDPYMIQADVTKNVPRKLQMQAYHIATNHLRRGPNAPKTDEPDEEPEQQRTPFSTQKKDTKEPSQAEPDDDDDDEGMPGAQTFKADADGNPIGYDDADSDDDPSPDPHPDTDMDTFFDDDSDDAGEPEPRTSDDREYPMYLPDPDERGEKSERAMFRIVSETDPVIDEFDPIWEKIKNAKNDIDVHSIIKSSKIPKALHSSAIIVARSIFDNTGRDWETGKKNEGLRRLYL